ncbi:MAG: hypothetical protein H6581_25400 [Bacteroidia bacterium]|nr:hypothetical protein [Bacteroidia bacterium]
MGNKTNHANEDGPEIDEKENEERSQIEIGEKGKFTESVIGDKNIVNITHTYGERPDYLFFRVDDHEIPWETIAEIEYYFVPPPHLEKAEDQLQKKILALKGEKGIGKQTLILKLASKIWKEGKIKRVFQISDSYNIPDYYLFEKLPSRSLLIITGVGESSGYSISKKMFPNSQKSTHNRVLRLLNESFLVLTTVTLNIHQFDLPDGIEFISCKTPDLEKLLQKLLKKVEERETKEKLEEYFEKKDREIVLNILGLPVKVKKFIEYAEKIVSTSSNEIQKELDGLLLGLNDPNREIGKYFSEISAEARVGAALLAVLGPGDPQEIWNIQKKILEQIFVEETKDIHEAERKVKKNPFGYSVEEISLEMRAIISESWQEIQLGKAVSYKIEFKDQSYSVFLLEYLKKNYPGFLEMVLVHLIAELELYSENLEYKIRLANAIGKIASINWPLVDSYIQQKTEDEKSRNRAIVGHIIQFAVQDPRLSLKLEKEIEFQSSANLHPENKNKLWANASILKQVSLENLEFSLECLGKMILSNNYFGNKVSMGGYEVFNAIKFALVVIALRSDLENFLKTFEVWLIAELKIKDQEIQNQYALIWSDISFAFSSIMDIKDQFNPLLELVMANQEIEKSLGTITGCAYHYLQNTELRNLYFRGKPVTHWFFDNYKKLLGIEREEYDKKIALILIRAGHWLRDNFIENHKRYLSYISKYWAQSTQSERIRKIGNTVLQNQ